MSGRTAFLLVLAAISPLRATADSSWGPAVLLAQIREQAIDESSGLARSLLHEGILWTLNDSRNEAELFAVDRTGSIASRTAVSNRENIDWEAVSTATLSDTAYIIIGDIGDNESLRESIAVHFAPEPQTLPAPVLDIEFSLDITLAGGATDAESLFLDGGNLFIITKRERPPRLHQVAIGDRSSGSRLSIDVGPVRHLPEPDPIPEGELPQLGPYSVQPTDTAMSPERDTLAVLTYRRIYLYERQPRMSWAEAVARPPSALDLPMLIQAEALTFTADGHLVMTSEKWPAPLVEIRRGTN